MIRRGIRCLVENLRVRMSNTAVLALASCCWREGWLPPTALSPHLQGLWHSSELAVSWIRELDWQNINAPFPGRVNCTEELEHSIGGILKAACGQQWHFWSMPPPPTTGDYKCPDFLTRQLTIPHFWSKPCALKKKKNPKNNQTAERCVWMAAFFNFSCPSAGRPPLQTSPPTISPHCNLGSGCQSPHLQVHFPLCSPFLFSFMPAIKEIPRLWKT